MLAVVGRGPHALRVFTGDRIYASCILAFLTALVALPTIARQSGLPVVMPPAQRCTVTSLPRRASRWDCFTRLPNSPQALRPRQLLVAEALLPSPAPRMRAIFRLSARQVALASALLH
jgi:hypothetical protein